MLELDKEHRAARRAGEQPDPTQGLEAYLARGAGEEQGQKQPTTEEEIASSSQFQGLFAPEYLPSAPFQGLSGDPFETPSLSQSVMLTRTPMRLFPYRGRGRAVSPGEHLTPRQQLFTGYFICTICWQTIVVW